MKIMDAYKITNGKVVWTVNVTRHLNDWEVNEYELLLQTLELSRLIIAGTRFCGN